MADLRVTLDARMALHSGIGRYIRGLTGALLGRGAGVALRLLGAPEAGGSWLAGAPVSRTPFEAEIYTLKEQFLGAWICRRLEPGTSVFHFPHYNVPWRVPRRTACAT